MKKLKASGKVFTLWKVILTLHFCFLLFQCGQVPQDQTHSSNVISNSSINVEINPKLLPKSAHTAHNRIKFGYAIQSCYVKLSGNFLVDGYNSFCGRYNQNQNISVGDVAYVNEISITGNVIITGQVF